MKTKGTRRHFNPAFKKDVKTLISEQGDSISKVSEAAGTTANNLRRWIKGLKREWLMGNLYPTREEAIADVRAYITFLQLTQNTYITGGPSLYRI
ncbi:transposase [Microbulbifer sp. DLAB2-AF]|uniref:transposase n=1 Tax=Microbulbifer sp. DLAB2-AF TaxID=3243395 RepID=UPI004039F53A